MRRLLPYCIAALFCSFAFSWPAQGQRANEEGAGRAPEKTAAEPRLAACRARTFAMSPEPQGPRKGRTGNRETGQMGLGIRLSTLGAGVEAATSIRHNLNLRGGGNFFQYDRHFDQDGVTYKGQLQLRSGEVHLDFYPIGHGFHLSPGLLVYNGNNLNASANVPGGTPFTLGSTKYLSDPTNPIAGKGRLDFRKAAPSVLFGFGNLVPRTKHFSANFETGVVFQGAARTNLNLTGGACDPTGVTCVNAATDPTVQANVKAEETKINNKVSSFKYFPVVSMGFGYRF